MCVVPPFPCPEKEKVQSTKSLLKKGVDCTAKDAEDSSAAVKRIRKIRRLQRNKVVKPVFNRCDVFGCACQVNTIGAEKKEGSKPPRIIKRRYSPAKYCNYVV